MASKEDYYTLLGVDRKATDDAIRKAFRKQAMQCHPDRNPDNPAAEAQFKQISEAYAVLSDTERRRRYDRMGHAAFSNAGGAPYEKVDFGSMSDILEGLFGDFFGNSSKRSGGLGRDIELDLNISFEEAALGASKTVEVNRRVKCEDCGGTGAANGTRIRECNVCNGSGEVRFQRGFFSVSRPCSACGGTGKKIDTPCGTCGGEGVVIKPEELTVTVPPGVENGSTRSVKGAGERGRNGAGDLHLRILVAEHPLFTREGADIRVSVPVSFPQAVLGAQIEVPTLEGMVKMRVPSGTQSGKVFRIRGKGIAVLGGYGKGDELVKIIVEVPDEVTKAQRKLITQLAAEMGEEVHPQRRNFLDKLRSLFE